MLGDSGASVIFQDALRNGGAVNAAGGSASGNSLSFGINAENVTISGGTVTATGGETEYYSCGIDADNVIVSGGTVTADGGTATGSYAESCGIYVTHGLTISGGEVTARTSRSR